MSTSAGVTQGVDTASMVPLYVQVEELLLRRITSGEWEPGRRIPTEQELCVAYGVSRVTVRQALARLVRRGLLSRARGRGTFVRDHRLTATARSVSSFSQELGALGKRPGAHVLGVDTVAASADVAAAMEREPGTELFRLRRVRTADGRPIAVQTSLLVAELFPGLPGRVREDGSLYEVLATHYAVVPVEAVEVFRVLGVPSSLAPLLEVPRGSHAFSVTRVTYDGRGAFEHTSSVIRGDSYEIRLALRNP
ncbi:GntR family transcriptional regulator [Georgenia sp. AZ-5]|uniref:GntR family transcriptional regulator n=1 Tax=Georgenia sp. AZ-5 TaxID=3367526 RepID=UPI00375424F4